MTIPLRSIVSSYARTFAFSFLLCFGGGAQADPVPVPLNIVSWWAGEDSGLDIAGGLDALPLGNPAFTNGTVARAFAFDGVNDRYVTFEDDKHDITGDLTIEGWINISGTSAGNRTIIQKPSSDGQNVCYSLSVNGGGKLTFSSTTAGSKTEVNTVEVLPVDTDVHVAITLFAGDLRMFINGAESAHIFFGTSRPATDAGAVLGVTSTGAINSAYFAGEIDELSLYSRALTAPEIAGIHGAGGNGKARFDAARDFERWSASDSVQSGAWRYGEVQRETSGQPAVANFTQYSTGREDNGLNFWNGASGPEVIANISGDFLTRQGAGGTNIYYPPGALTLHPGASGQYAVLKWTAPAAGDYAVSALFAGADGKPTTTDVLVLDETAFGNFTLLPRTQINGCLYENKGATRPVFQKVALEAGEKVYFLVGYGANADASFDSTSVFAHIVPLRVLAAGPIATTTGAFTVTDATARLDGVVNANGAATTVRFDYGTTTSYGQSVSAQSVPASASAQTVSAALVGLNPGTLYHFRIVATNADGTGFGADKTFTTTGGTNPNAPGVTLSPVTNVTSTGATLNGTIDRKGNAVSYSFEYGTTASYGQTAGASVSFPGTEPYPVDAALTALSPGTVYHYRLVATSNGNTGTTPDATFKTRAARGDFTVTVSGVENGATIAPTDDFNATAKISIPRGSKTKIASVQFYIDGEPAGQSDSKAAYKADLRISAAGPHFLTAVATDTAGKEVESAQIVFKVAEAGAGPIALSSTVFPIGSTVPGELITYTLTATNGSNQDAKNVELTLQVPIGAGYVDTRFADANGQPIATPKDIDVSFNGGNGVVTVKIKEIKAFATLRVQLLARVPYDQTVTGNVIASSTFGITAVQGKTKFTGTFVPRSLTVGGALPAGAARPRLGIFVKQLGAGELPQDKNIITVTTAALGVPDVKPDRLSNEITYQVTVANYGNAPAHSVRVVAPVPPGTTYKPKSAGVLTTAGDSIPVEEAEAFGLLFFDVPRLEPNFASLPSVPGSAKTIQYTVRVDQDALPLPPLPPLITHLGAAVTSGELLTPFSTLVPKVARVVAPVQMTHEFTRQYVKSEDQPVDSAAGTITHTIFFHNQGGVAAKDAGIRYTVPPGLAFQDAAFANHLGAPQPLKKGQTISKPVLNATSGNVLFTIGTVKPGDFGFAQVTLKLDPGTRPGGTNPVQSSDGAFRSDAPYVCFDSSTVGLAGVRSAASAPVKSGLLGPQPNLAGLIRQPHFDTSLPRLFALQAGPASATENGEIVYQIAWGNVSKTDAPSVAMYFGIPYGTQLVSASGSETFGNLVNDDAYFVPLDGAYPNGVVNWVGAMKANSVKTATIRVKLNAGKIGAVESAQALVFSSVAGLRYVPPIATAILAPETAAENQQGTIYSASVGAGDAAGIGSARAPAEKFNDVVRQITGDSRTIGIAGADYAHIAGNDGIAIPLGGGRLVAAGGGNFVNASTASMVAAGGGNLVAAGGGNMQVAVPGSGFLTSTQLISNAPSLVAAGGMNMVAAGGMNLLRKTSSLVGNDGASLIGLDGSTLIGLDGATLGTFSQRVGFAASFTPKVGASLNLTANAASLVAAGGGNVRIAGGGNLVAAGGGNVIPPATLVGNDGASVIARDGAGLIGNDGSTLIGNDGSTLIGNDGSTMVAAGGGNFVTGTTGMVAAGGGN